MKTLSMVVKAEKYLNFEKEVEVMIELMKKEDSYESATFLNELTSGITKAVQAEGFNGVYDYTYFNVIATLKGDIVLKLEIESVEETDALHTKISEIMKTKVIDTYKKVTPTLVA